jgi:hypothetical protein
MEKTPQPDYDKAFRAGIKSGLAQRAQDRRKVLAGGLAALATGSLLATAEKSQGAVYGFTAYTPATNTVTSGSQFFMDLLQGTFNSTNVGSGTYRFRVYNTPDASVYPTGVIFFNDASQNNLITNGFHAGKTLDATSSLTTNTSLNYYEIKLGLMNGYSSGTGVVARVLFDAVNNLGMPSSVIISNGSVSVSRPGGTFTSSGGSWAKTNTIDVALGGNPSPWTDVIVDPPVPEPATAALLFVGGLTAFLRRKRKK